MWDLIVSVPDHCLSFYFDCIRTWLIAVSCFCLRLGTLMHITRCYSIDIDKEWF